MLKWNDRSFLIRSHSFTSNTSGIIPVLHKVSLKNPAMVYRVVVCLFAIRLRSNIVTCILSQPSNTGCVSQCLVKILHRLFSRRSYLLTKTKSSEQPIEGMPGFLTFLYILIIAFSHRRNDEILTVKKAPLTTPDKNAVRVRELMLAGEWEGIIAVENGLVFLWSWWYIQRYCPSGNCWNFSSTIWR